MCSRVKGNLDIDWETMVSSCYPSVGVIQTYVLSGDSCHPRVRIIESSSYYPGVQFNIQRFQLSSDRVKFKGFELSRFHCIIISRLFLIYFCEANFSFESSTLVKFKILFIIKKRCKKRKKKKRLRTQLTKQRIATSL